MRRTAAWLIVCVLGLAFTLVSREPQDSAKMKRAFRQPEKNGWIFVHLEGSPAQIGFQHGALLAREIDDARKVIGRRGSHGLSR